MFPTEIFVVFIVFGTLFGLAYLFFSTRNKERMALIDKGADASIFFSKERRSGYKWKVFVVTLALLLVGVGVGVFLGGFFSNVLGMDEEVAFPGTIFVTAGLGLYLGFKQIEKIKD